MYADGPLGAAQMATATREISPIDSACGRLTSSNDKSAALVNELHARLEVVLRPATPVNEATSAPPTVPESPLHQDLINKISDVDRLNLRLQDILGRLTV